MLSVIMPGVAFFYYSAYCRYAKPRFAECSYAQYRGAKNTFFN